jgi:hypothetical protein
LWTKIVLVYRESATFYTVHYDVNTGVIPAARHKAITKHARHTHLLERFANTLWQCISPLARDTWSFSKKLAHHIDAITNFIGRNKFMRAAARPV